jgi:hypothetical protein
LLLSLRSIGSATKETPTGKRKNRPLGKKTQPIAAASDHFRFSAAYKRRVNDGADIG